MAGKSSDWVRLNCNMYEDDKILKAGPTAEHLYLRSLMWCGRSMTDGHFTLEQIKSFARGLTHLRRRIDRCLTFGLWTQVDESGLCLVTAWSKYNKSAEAIDAARRRDRRRKSGERAAHVRTDSMSREENLSRHVQAPDTETSSNRTPSGSVRLELADEPHRADGAARPPKITPVGVGFDEDVTPMDGDPKKIARELIAKGRAKNPAAGRQFSYRKPPSRIGEPEAEPSPFRLAMERLSILDNDETE